MATLPARFATLTVMNRQETMAAAPWMIEPPWASPRVWWRVQAWLDALRPTWAQARMQSGGKPADGAVISADLDLEGMVTEHASAAYRVALSIARDRDLAEDITQDAMLKAWQALPSYRGDAPLRNWVLRITHNTAISTLRKRREVLKDPHDLPERPTARSVERQAHGRMALNALDEALEDLDELTRSIVVLRELEGLSYEEISVVLGQPLPTVKTRLFRARRQLAMALEGWRS